MVNSLARVETKSVWNFHDLWMISAEGKGGREGHYSLEFALTYEIYTNTQVKPVSACLAALFPVLPSSSASLVATVVVVFLSTLLDEQTERAKPSFLE